MLDLKPLITQSDQPVDCHRARSGVRFRDVDFHHPAAAEVSLASLESVAVEEARSSDQILHGVDFEIPAGGLVALVGPSGAGKTTITALVARLYDVDAGAVLLNDVDVRDISLDSLRQTVGYVTQDAHMFHDTILANLRYADPDASEQQIWAACEDAQIAGLLRSLPDGLNTVVGDRGYRLSGGEKQRLAIARLLLKRPGVVVLDEATAHLDSENERAVQVALSAALTGRTSLVIAHRLSTVRDADLILVVENGRIAERGRHDELLARGDSMHATTSSSVSAPPSDHQGDRNRSR